MRYLLLILIYISCSDNHRVEREQLSSKRVVITEPQFVTSIQICSYLTKSQTVSSFVVRGDTLFYILHDDYQKIFGFNLVSHECFLKRDFGHLPPKGFDRHLIISYDEHHNLFLYNTQLDIIIQLSQDGNSCTYKRYLPNEHQCSVSSENVNLFFKDNALIALASCYPAQSNSAFKEKSYNIAFCEYDANQCTFFINYPDFYQNNIVPINALIDLDMTFEEDSLYLMYPALPRIYRYLFRNHEFKFIDYIEFSSTLIPNAYVGMKSASDGFDEFIYHYTQGFYGTFHKIGTEKYCLFASKSNIDQSLKLNQIESATEIMTNLEHTLLVKNGIEFFEYRLPNTIPEYSFKYKGLIYLFVESDNPGYLKYSAIKI